MHIKPTWLYLTCILVGLAFFSQAQIKIIGGINLPQDSVVKNQLITSLNGFLDQKEKPNKDNTFALKENLLETSALLDEIKGMERNSKAKDFFKPYLNNVVKQDESNFIIQFSYMGLMDGTPILRASFRLIAKKEGDKFYFSSPLKQNTVAWKTRKIGKISWYYKDTLNKADVKAYQNSIDLYDKKLKAVEWPIQFYYCDKFPEVQQVLGIEYKADYNGMRTNNLTSRENNANLMVNGWNSSLHRYDPHDLWHERLRNVMSSDIINRPVDEGCAYLYGGSWGYTWDEILAKFKKYVTANPNADWLSLYMDVTNFEGGEKPLKVAYVLNALIVQKIEGEKGFEPVMELLGCGKKEKGDENYFKALEKITGINKANFNAKMVELLRSLQ